MMLKYFLFFALHGLCRANYVEDATWLSVEMNPPSNNIDVGDQQNGGYKIVIEHKTRQRREAVVPGPDPCASNPCGGRGNCTKSNNGQAFVCHCRPGYDGVRCLAGINDCLDKCQNGANCVDDDESYTCLCAPGTSGRHCEHVTPCADSPCPVDAHCFVTSNAEMITSDSEPEESYECVCNSGSMEFQCLSGYAECYEGRCKNNGTCVHNENHEILCLCNTGFLGPLCDQVDYCEDVYCWNGGTCVNYANTYGCHCAPGYSGRSCQFYNACHNITCFNGGICREHEHEHDKPTCDCSGTTITTVGEYCQFVDPCEANVCGEGGTCKSRLIETPDSLTGYGYTCTCHPPFEGDQCDFIPNDCGCYHGNCTSDGKGCKCFEGFTGTLCRKASVCNPSPCKNGGLCVTQYRGRHQCYCPAGYSQNDNCEHVKRSACEYLPCGYNGRCIDIGDGHLCQCEFPYFGIKCEEILPCGLPENPCGKYGICIQNGYTVEDTSFSCQCIEGYGGVNCSEQINIAAYRKVYALVDMEDASKIVDSLGSVGDSCYKIEGKYENPWIAIDLGRTYDIDRVSVSLKNKIIAREYRVLNVFVWNALVGGDAPNLYSCGAAGNPLEDGTFNNITCSIRPLGRFVYVMMNSTLHAPSFGVCDVEIYGVLAKRRTCTNTRFCKNGRCYVSNYSIQRSCECKIGYNGTYCDIEINVAFAAHVWPSSVDTTISNNDPDHVASKTPLVKDSMDLHKYGSTMDLAKSLEVVVNHRVMEQCFQTNSETKPWIQLELFSFFWITSVNLVQRTISRIPISEFAIGVADKLIIPPDIAYYNKCFQSKVELDYNQRFYCTYGAMFGKYVIVQVSEEDSAVLQLCEIAVYGTEAKSGCASNPCHNGATCLPHDDFQYRCHCNLGFSDRHCNTEVNIARGRRTYMSSQHGRYSSDNGVDGDKWNVVEYGSCFHTNLQDRPWFMVDLSLVYTIEKIVFYNRVDEARKRLRDVVIGLHTVVDDLTNPGFGTVCDHLGGVQDILSYETHCKTLDQEARYVSIHINYTRSYLHLCEVEVYGRAEFQGCFDGFCENGGTCVSWDRNEYTCRCQLSFEGRQCEIAINLARARAVESSDTISPHTKDRVNDGVRNLDMDTGSCMKTQIVSNPYIEVDLGEIYVIDKIVADSPEPVTNFQIKLRNTTGETIECMYHAGKLKNSKIVARCGTKTLVAQFVKILNKDVERALKMCEIVVYGNAVFKGCNAGICANGGTCISTSDNQDFICRCLVGFYGKFCQGDTNIALGKPVLISSYKPPYMASRVVDGNINGVMKEGSCLHTREQVNPWFVIDLEDVYVIRRITVFNRKDQYAYRLRNLEFGVNKTLTSGSGEFQECDYMSGVQEKGIYSTTCKNKIFKGRYVRIRLRTTSILHLCEVQVNGHLENTASDDYHDHPLTDYYIESHDQVGNEEEAEEDSGPGFPAAANWFASNSMFAVWIGSCIGVVLLIIAVALLVVKLIHHRRQGKADVKDVVIQSDASVVQ